MARNFSLQANFLKETRKKVGLSQGQLAKAVGVHVQYISNIERGLCGIPHVRAKAIAKALKTNVHRISEAVAYDYRLRYVSMAEGVNK